MVQDHGRLNERTYSSLLKLEMEQIISYDYAVLMQGDFNGHLGPLSTTNPSGIPGYSC